MEGPATNPSSKFTPFRLSLPGLPGGEGIVTGIAYIPPSTSAHTSAKRPLIVGVHGGQCTAHTFDVTPEHTASLSAEAHGVPFVAINRPGYQGSTDFSYPLPENTSHYRKTGTWEHEYIFPVIWEHFGKPNECSGLVPLFHSMGCPGGIVAAALWSREDPSQRKYPLAGFIMSGWGAFPKALLDLSEYDTNNAPTEWRKLSNEVKRMLMLSEQEKGHAASPRMFELCDQQHVAMRYEEYYDARSLWRNYWQEYSNDVRVPILYAIAEDDFAWEGSQAQIDQFGAGFSKCPRFDGKLIENAPHALEWYKDSQAWYELCFTWSLNL